MLSRELEQRLDVWMAEVDAFCAVAHERLDELGSFLQTKYRLSRTNENIPLWQDGMALQSLLDRAHLFFG